MIDKENPYQRGGGGGGLLVEKALDLWKKAQIVGTRVQYTFEVAKTKEIFDFLVEEKLITFPQDHQIPSKDELRGKTYCKYHNSWNHTTNACWGFKNVIHDRIKEMCIVELS